MADGSFDPLHHGHIAYLRAAASLGYPVLVNLCPDSETAKKHPVLLPAADRAKVLEALGCVSYVHVSEQPTVDVLRQLQPVAYVKGADWIDTLPTAIGQVCDELGIRIRYLDAPMASSSALLKQFQPDVDAFERLVQGQKLPDTPWKPTEAVPYDFESRRVAEGKHPDVLLSTFGAGPYLDYGCGPDAILVRLIRERGVMAYGTDPQLREQWRCLQPHYDTDLETFVGHFPVVICREVFEHVLIRQIQPLIRRFKEFAPQFVYATTRFAKNPAHLLSVDTSDDLDPDHRTMLHHDFLRTLFVLEGFTRRADLEQRMDWRGLNRVLVYERG